MRVNPDCLRSMMRTYGSDHHCVAAFELRDQAVEYLHAGNCFADIPLEQVIFEIGSITKVFTGILLCVLIEEGSIDPHAPIREMCEDLAKLPAQLTPEALISHTSGLPNIHMPL